jgi:hypothetical protein
MDESSRLSPPAIQHHNMLYDHTTEKMVEAMFIYFPCCQHSEVFFMFEEKLYEAQSGYEYLAASYFKLITR